jgi:hypothetical protein
MPAAALVLHIYIAFWSPTTSPPPEKKTLVELFVVNNSLYGAAFMVCALVPHFPTANDAWL